MFGSCHICFCRLCTTQWRTCASRGRRFGRFAECASSGGLGLACTVVVISIPYPRHSFGIKADVKDNIWYIDEMQVVFPVGNNIVLHNVEQKVQRFIAGASTATTHAPRP